MKYIWELVAETLLIEPWEDIEIARAEPDAETRGKGSACLRMMKDRTLLGKARKEGEYILGCLNPRVRQCAHERGNL